MKSIVVLYHANCPDGFGAAWAAWGKFKNRADYLPVEPNELPAVPLRGREIYALDTSFAPAVLKKLVQGNRSVTVIDHHRTNAGNVRYASQAVFDLKHSGAVLTWRFFHPSRPVPLLLRYVEDGDLWQFKLPHAGDLLSFVYSRPQTFIEWECLHRDFSTAAGRRRSLAWGKVIATYDRVLIAEAVWKARPVRFGRFTALAVNSSSKRFHSEIGQALVKLKPPIGIVWHVDGDTVRVSLRSNGRVDVSKIAARFGGGGHRAASGFSVPARITLPWTPLEASRPRRR